MILPIILCDLHLRGEHFEIHKFVGAILKGKKLDGYARNNLLEPLSLRSRHDELVEEMIERDMNHNSPLPYFSVDHLHYKNVRVDSERSLRDLLLRCVDCRVRYYLYGENSKEAYNEGKDLQWYNLS